MAYIVVQERNVLKKSFNKSKHHFVSVSKVPKAVLLIHCPSPCPPLNQGPHAIVVFTLMH